MIDKNNYHEDVSRVSKSGLDVINRTPLDYWYWYLQTPRPKRKVTDALLLGQAIHVAVFEPEEFFVQFITPPEKLDLRRRLDKERHAEFEFAAQGKKLLKRETYNQCMFMREAVMNDPIAGELLRGAGTKEEVLTWTDPETGVDCKSRLDFRHHETNLIIDLKSAGVDIWSSAAPSAFRRSVSKYRYHVQNAFYTDGLFHSTSLQTPGFIFIVVEKEPPFKVAKYQLTDQDVQFGREEYIQNLNTYKQCMDSGVWPGYSQKIESLALGIT